MKNKLKKTMTALCAALILMGGFSVPAYAQGTAAEPPAGDATNDSGVIVEEKEETPPLTAVVVNGYYSGYLGEDMSLDELTAGVRRHYENGYSNIGEFIEVHDDRLPPELIEEARAAAYAAALPFSEKAYRDGEEPDPYLFDGSMSMEDYELMHRMIENERSERMAEIKTGYSTYDHDRLDPADSMRIERKLYFEQDKADISGLTVLSMEQLREIREESVAAEQTIYEDLKQRAVAWEAQAGQTLAVDKAIEYVRTPEVKHTAMLATKLYPLLPTTPGTANLTNFPKRKTPQSATLQSLYINKNERTLFPRFVVVGFLYSFGSSR